MNHMWYISTWTWCKLYFTDLNHDFIHQTHFCLQTLKTKFNRSAFKIFWRLNMQTDRTCSLFIYSPYYMEVICHLHACITGKGLPIPIVQVTWWAWEPDCICLWTGNPCWIWGSHGRDMKRRVLWVATPCSSERSRYFEGTRRLNVEGLYSKSIMEPAEADGKLRESMSLRKSNYGGPASCWIIPELVNEIEKRKSSFLLKLQQKEDICDYCSTWVVRIDLGFNLNSEVFSKFISVVIQYYAPQWRILLFHVSVQRVAL
jgi:hypothetical protein